MSGYSGAQLTERARAAGAGEVLRKPLVRRDIAEALARALRQNIAATPEMKTDEMTAMAAKPGPSQVVVSQDG